MSDSAEMYSCAAGKFMESLAAYYLALLLVSDCEMFARLKQRVVSGEMGTGVDRMLDFVV